jgi:hypothetical protein
MLINAACAFTWLLLRSYGVLLISICVCSSVGSTALVIMAAVVGPGAVFPYEKAICYGRLVKQASDDLERCTVLLPSDSLLGTERCINDKARALQSLEEEIHDVQRAHQELLDRSKKRG